MAEPLPCWNDRLPAGCAAYRLNRPLALLAGPLDRRPAYRPKRQKSPVGTTRRGRVHRRSRILASGHHSYTQVNLSGDRLAEAGFPLGQRYEVDVERGRLVVRAV